MRVNPWLVTLGLLIGGSAQAATLRVGPSRPYTTVMAAYAAAHDGDELILDEGNYIERFDFFGADVTIVGTNYVEFEAANGAPRLIRVAEGAKIGLRDINAYSAEQVTLFTVLNGAELTVNGGSWRSAGQMLSADAGTVAFANTNFNSFGGTDTLWYAVNGSNVSVTSSTLYSDERPVLWSGSDSHLSLVDTDVQGYQVATAFAAQRSGDITAQDSSFVFDGGEVFAISDIDLSLLRVDITNDQYLPLETFLRGRQLGTVSIVDSNVFGGAIVEGATQVEVLGTASCASTTAWNLVDVVKTSFSGVVFSPIGLVEPLFVAQNSPLFIRNAGFSPLMGDGLLVTDSPAVVENSWIGYTEGDVFSGPVLVRHSLLDERVAAWGVGITLGKYAVRADLGLPNLGEDICEGFSERFIPATGSPLLDAGVGVDIDGSPADIGPYGGPDAPNDAWVDFDGDGVPNGTDCDIYEPKAWTNAPELCDGIDNNCNGTVDEEMVLYTDIDLDGYGDALSSVRNPGCEVVLAGLSVLSGDCDDGDAAIHPGVVDTCDSVDQDCDGIKDETDVLWVTDADTDGFGAVPQFPESCDAPPEGIALDGGDCDDRDNTAYPGAAESCDGLDNDCNGRTDEGVGTDYYPDDDFDGYGDSLAAAVAVCAGPVPTGYTKNNEDCDDSAFLIRPGADERCDDVDENCDGLVDENPVDGELLWFDYDNDGFGDPDVQTQSCRVLTGYLVADGGAEDCDDANARVYLGAPEVCDGIDNNCYGGVDEAGPDASHPSKLYYVDDDGDGVGVTNLPTLEACAPPVGYATVSGDCDDDDSTRFPGAFDVCGDGIDQDCFGTDANCADLDGDGFCPGTALQCGLIAPGDCNDHDDAIWPSAVEVCNGLDDDCDGIVDDGLTSDDDRDGFTKIGSCGGVAEDCNDQIASIHPFPDPDAESNELCNGLDDDCDGARDEGSGRDDDNDGYSTTPFCGFGTADCDDSNATVHPFAEEISGGDLNNGVDEDCDGIVDEDSASDDDDGDGYCEAETCSSETALPGDCDDFDITVHPGSTEIIDGLDNDCDGNIDNPSIEDHDGDGVSAFDGDCNDANPKIHPAFTPDLGSPIAAAVELCNGLDDNCDRLLPADEADFDRDHWRACTPDNGEFFDCNDLDARVYPFRVEDCSDGIDNNCDGVTDIDKDDDGDGFTTCLGDCWDRPGLGEAIHPGAAELCNDFDDDCDGTTDEGFDRDDDKVQSCACGTDDCDCDDLNALVHPGNAEQCPDGLDNDCDGTADIGVDVDGDGFDTCAGDCNDRNTTINPGVVELCDGVDNNCNGQIDEGYDDDQDQIASCQGDCDDRDPDANPYLPELACDTLDNDCDGIYDEVIGLPDTAIDTGCEADTDTDADSDSDTDADSDSDADSDTDVPVEPPPTYVVPRGCVCDGSGSGSASSGLVLLAVAAALRRRRDV